MAEVRRPSAGADRPGLRSSAESVGAGSRPGRARLDSWRPGRQSPGALPRRPGRAASRTSPDRRFPPISAPPPTTTPRPRSSPSRRRGIASNRRRPGEIGRGGSSPFPVTSARRTGPRRDNGRRSTSVLRFETMLQWMVLARAVGGPDRVLDDGARVFFECGDRRLASRRFPDRFRRPRPCHCAVSLRTGNTRITTI